jgi:hypothetical protein
MTRLPQYGQFRLAITVCLRGASALPQCGQAMPYFRSILRLSGIIETKATIVAKANGATTNTSTNVGENLSSRNLLNASEKTAYAKKKTTAAPIGEQAINAFHE